MKNKLFKNLRNIDLKYEGRRLKLPNKFVYRNPKKIEDRNEAGV